MSRQIKFIQGNEACVEGALYAGLDFFAGYPITPSTEIAEHLSVRLPRRGGKFIQMEDEIASMAAAIGASLTGHKSMTATSGPGFSLKQENLGQLAGGALDNGFRQGFYPGIVHGHDSGIVVFNPVHRPGAESHHQPQHSGGGIHIFFNP